MAAFTFTFPRQIMAAFNMVAGVIIALFAGFVLWFYLSASSYHTSVSTRPLQLLGQLVIASSILLAAFYRDRIFCGVRLSSIMATSPTCIATYYGKHPFFYLLTLLLTICLLSITAARMKLRNFWTMLPRARLSNMNDLFGATTSTKELTAALLDISHAEDATAAEKEAMVDIILHNSIVLASGRDLVAGGLPLVAGGQRRSGHKNSRCPRPDAEHM